jgi:hypothetical protein
MLIKVIQVFMKICIYIMFVSIVFVSCTVNYIPYTAVFTFYNSSNDTVFVDTITYSCTCVKLLSKFSFIPPGTIDSISVSISSKNGYINRSVSVVLEEQQEPITLILDGYIDVK